MTKLEREISASEFLATVEDAEERERFRREFCMLEFDESGHHGFNAPQGSGPQATLNGSIIGADFDAHLQTSLGSTVLADEFRDEQQAAAAAKAMSAAHLTRDDVQELYDAVSFLTQEHGVFMNGFVTIVYKLLGVNDESAMTKLLTEFLDEASGQLKRWGHQWHAVYVLEQSAKNGLHTHLLVHVPEGLKGAFVDWTQQSFFKRKCPQMSPDGVHLQLKQPTTISSKASWQWDRVQYITKGLDPNVMARDLGTGALTPLFDLIGQRPNYRRAAGAIPFRQRVGGSKSIWSKARSKVAPEGLPGLSAIGDRAWPYLRLDSPHLGWEIHEFAVRKKMRDWVTERREITRGDPDLDNYLHLLKLTWDDLMVLHRDDYKRVQYWIWEARVQGSLASTPYRWRRMDWRSWWETLPGLAQWGGSKVRKELASRAAAAGTPSP